MPAYSRILLPWDSQPQEVVGVNPEFGLRRAILGNILSPTDLADGVTITRLSGGSVPSPLSAGVFGVGSRHENASYNGVISTPGWTDRTGEASFCLVFDRNAAGDTSPWELGAAAGDEFPFSSQAYFDVAWTSRWGSAVNAPSGAAFSDPIVLVFCVKNGEQRAYWNGALWHSNTATGGFAIPATLTFAKRNLEGVFFAGFGSERFWTASEATSIGRNPWQLFAPRTIVVPVSFAAGTSYTITPSGGITFAGSGLDLRTKVFDVSGGVTFAGTGSMVFASGGTTYTITPSGGVTMGGAGGFLKSKTITPTGGVTMGGTSDMIKTQVVSPTGGVLFGGTGSMESNTSTAVESNERTKVGVGA